MVAGFQTLKRKGPSPQTWSIVWREQGLIGRQPDPMDRRGTILALTKQTMRKLPSLFASLGTAWKRSSSGYPQKEPAVLK